jgi:WD40 repeat protein
MRGLGLVTLSAATDIVSTKPYKHDTALLELSNDNRTFVTYGQSSSVALWSSFDLSPRRIFETVTSSVSHVAFIDDANDFVTSGRDGRLIRWTSNGEQRPLHKFDQPIETFAFAGESRRMVVSTNDGELWRVDEDSTVASLRRAVAKVTRMLALPDGTSICVGYSNGETILIETRSWRQYRLLSASAAIRDLAVAKTNNVIVAADNDSDIHIGIWHRDFLETASIEWSTIRVNARKIALTDNGLLVAICPNGAMWVYSLTRRTWLFLPIGTTDLIHIVFSTNGNVAVVFDADGHIISIDMAAVHATLDHISNNDTDRRLYEENVK